MTWPGLRHVWDCRETEENPSPPCTPYMEYYVSMYVHSLYGVRKADGRADMQIFFFSLRSSVAHRGAQKAIPYLDGGAP